MLHGPPALSADDKGTVLPGSDVPWPVEGTLSVNLCIDNMGYISVTDTSKESAMPITFMLNDRSISLDVEGEMPLLWALRDVLKLTGTKFGCGAGLCGACTVHREGEAIRACTTPMSSVQGRRITTIEGLGGQADHPLQDAWIRHNVAQCGYCQPGQIMAASALLAQNPSPTDEDIDRAMAGNLCRCGTYSRIRAAIHDAAGQLQSDSGQTPAPYYQSNLES